MALLRKTPLKAKTALKAKTPLKAKTTLKSNSTLKTNEPLKAKSTLKSSTTTKRKKGADDLKTWIAKVDKVFSLYIRLRDSREFHFQRARCISCGKVKPFSMMDAGHYVSRNCMALRYNPSNVNAECESCNRYHSDHLIGYRRRLVIKLGTEAVKGSAVAEGVTPEQRLKLIQKVGEKIVMQLEATKYSYRKWSVEELKQKYKYYAALVLQYKNEM